MSAGSDGLSAPTPASPEVEAMMEQLKGLTLVEAAALMKDMEETFNLGPKDEEEEEEAVAAE